MEHDVPPWLRITVVWTTIGTFAGLALEPGGIFGISFRHIGLFVGLAFGSALALRLRLRRQRHW